MPSPLLRPGDAAKKLGVSCTTLRRWEREGRISTVRTQGGHRRFDENVLPGRPSITIARQEECRKYYAYCRVSSSKQKDDLQRQIKAFQETHPEHEIISDVGSGLNFKRKGFLRMVDEIMRGRVKEVVVSHRDRLCRFAYERFEWICQKHGTTLVVKDRLIRSAEQELSEDLMAIVHVFSCRHHGTRRYAKKPCAVPENPPSSHDKTGPEVARMDESCQGHVQ